MRYRELFYRHHIAKYSKTLGQILYINIIVKIAVYLYVFSQMFIVYDALAEPLLKRMNNINSSAVLYVFSQMFIVYDALAEPSLKRMNNIVGSAVNMCAVAYLLVSTFSLLCFTTKSVI